MINKNIVKAIALKEYRHIIRDPFVLIFALLLPLILVVFLGLIIDLDYKHIPIVVKDDDNSKMSRCFSNIFKISEYFNLSKLKSIEQVYENLYKNDSPAILIIKSDFSKNIVKGIPAQVQLLIDGSDNTKSAAINSYLLRIPQRANEIFSKQVGTFLQNKQNDFLRTQFLFNPQLKSSWFIVPGLSTIIVGLIAIVLTSLTIAREWETGSMELLLSTPVNPIEIVIGKIIPYFILNIVSILMIFVSAITIFQIPFRRNFFLYLTACIIYIIASLSFGLLISILTRKQQTAIQFALAAGLLPSFFFSSFIFSIENMPIFFEYFTMIFPQRHFMAISRNLFLTPTDFSSFFPCLVKPFLMILLFAFIMVSLAKKKLKKDLEI
jgi:ABC-2 type transport system permease protein